MSDLKRDPDVPDILVFPPILLGGAMLLGALLDWLLPIPLLSPVAARVLGAALFVFSAALGFSAQRALRRAGTNISPNEPTLALVTDGPYRRTRNPLYLAGLGVYLGVALFINGLAPFLLLVPLAVLLHWGIVLREERYLTTKFGETYRVYQTQVRRWL
jgi:protein-S-isoprenylcysteine O-methyltransferase Ste14